VTVHNPYVRRQQRGRIFYGHVDVAVRALGRSLPHNAVVHHVNGNARDNRNTNLVVLQNSSEHTALHYRQRVLRAGGDPFNQHLCVKCGAVKAPEAFYPQKGRPIGRKSICIECWRIR
jgi:recombinational DNA repair protein (RecF pathway)